MEIAFRTDASNLIGCGHLMRCLTLADALRQKGARCLFVCGSMSGRMAAVIKARGFEVKLLGKASDPKIIFSAHDYKTWLGASVDADAEDTIRALQGRNISWLITDHYGIDANWERKLRPFCDKMMAIDDLANRSHDSDILLDSNLAVNIDCRYKGLLQEGSSTLLGPRFALINPYYASLKKQKRSRGTPVHRVFVYFGGADCHNLTGRVATAFMRVADEAVRMDVVMSPDSRFFPELTELARHHSNIHLYGQVPNLADLLSKADLAFGGGGVTNWERCCLGVPSYVITLAENQIGGTRALEERGAVRWLGNAETISDKLLNEAMKEALEGRQLSLMSEISEKIVDGLGALRVAECILAGPGTAFTLRNAEPDDEGLVLNWANDKEVRGASFNHNHIDASSHRRWMKGRLADTQGCKFFIVETRSGLPVGPVRFEKVSDETWEIHFSIDSCLRGRGVSTPFLSSAVEHFRKTQKTGKFIVGRVMRRNARSQSLFRKLGFSESIDGENFRYELCLKR